MIQYGAVIGPGPVTWFVCTNVIGREVVGCIAFNRNKRQFNLFQFLARGGVYLGKVVVSNNKVIKHPGLTTILDPGLVRKCQSKYNNNT